MSEHAQLNVSNDYPHGGLRLYSQQRASDPSFPLVSILTVSYNAAATLERTILSVLQQDYPAIQHIVIDGGSSDDTLVLLKKYDNKIDYWHSRPDQGIYDALNGALKRATGDIVAILNADDAYLPGVIRSVVDVLLRESRVDFVYGSVRMPMTNGYFLITHPLEFSDFMTTGLSKMPCPHVSIFARKALYDKAGWFDVAFRIAADHDMTLRFVQLGAQGKALPIVFAELLPGGVSASSWPTCREIMKVACKHGRSVWVAAAVCALQYAKNRLFTYVPIGLKNKLLKSWGSRHRML